MPGSIHACSDITFNFANMSSPMQASSGHEIPCSLAAFRTLFTGRLWMIILEETLMREIQEQMGWNSDEMAIDDILKVEVGNQEVVVHRK